MSFVEQEDVLEMFEGLTKYMFREVLNVEVGDFPWMPWSEAMEKYGSDKPDIRFEMKINDISELAKGKGFGVFDSAGFIGAICAKGCSEYTRKQLDDLTNWVKRPQIGAKGLVYVRYNTDGSIKSSVDKFFPPKIENMGRNRWGSPRRFATGYVRRPQPNVKSAGRTAARNRQSVGFAHQRRDQAALGC
jgi:aspartyl-tRNA synthetase